MPFLFKYNNENYLLYTKNKGRKVHCGREYVMWKVHCRNLNTGLEFKVFTNQHDDDIECSPSLYIKNNKIFFYYIGTEIDDFSVKYRMIEMEFDNVLDMDKECKNAKVFANVTYGGVNEYYKVFSYKDKLKIVNRSDSSKRFYELNGDIYRVVNIYGEDSKFIITERNGDRYLSYIFDCYTFNKQIIKVDGVDDIYKSTILGDEIVFAKRVGDFEDRELIFSKYTTESI